MNPAWKTILKKLAKVKKLSPEQAEKLVAALNKAQGVGDAIDEEFISPLGDVIRGGVKSAMGKAGIKGTKDAAAVKEALKKSPKNVAESAGTLWEHDPDASGTLWEAPWAKTEQEAARAASTGRKVAGAAEAAATPGRAGRIASSVGRGLGTAAKGAGTGLGAAWRMSRPWMGVAGKGALLGLGGLGALYTLLELPGMVSDGLDIAEDAGLDPRGRKQPLKAALQNRLAMQGAEGMEGAGENEMLERVSGTLGRMEGMHETGTSYGALPEAAAAKMGMLRELPFLAAHQDELMAIQKKAAMQDSFEAAAMRLLGR